MTALREKIGQLFMLGFAGQSVSPELAALLAEYQPGGLILFARNLASPTQMLDLTNDLQKRSPHSPLLIAIDQEGGRVSRLPAGFTIFPPCAMIGRCHSSELAYAAAAATALELRAVGVNMNMAPVLDIHTNPDNPIIGDRAFGSDPDLVCELGLATIAGLQDHRVVSCGKHFPGHGDTSADSHKELPTVAASRDRLTEAELRPFSHVIAQGEFGPATLMTAHVLYPALDGRFPATLSPAILTELLREQLRFDGVVLTDDMEMHAIVDYYGIGEASIRAFQAGADIILICKDRDRAVAAMEALYKAVQDGTISEARMDASLRRIARVKARFLHPYKPADPSTAHMIVGNRTHRALLGQLLEAGQRSIIAPA
ncbi:MAG: beta-N-acetylhexosaminidase [Nitrospira sp.]|nr:beta-N-acetylhexosaminidase [Nitrospira sp.]